MVNCKLPMKKSVIKCTVSVQVAGVNCSSNS